MENLGNNLANYILFSFSFYLSHFGEIFWFLLFQKPQSIVKFHQRTNGFFLDDYSKKLKIIIIGQTQLFDF
jgi:hypothetical protein